MNLKKTETIGVVMGGRSREREISLRSGANVLNALNDLGYETRELDPSESDFYRGASEIDLAFIALHGVGGEDGQIQGFFQTLGIPYTGSGVEASAVCMNKRLTKERLIAAGVPTAPYQMLDLSSNLSALPFSFPVVVKPLWEGSSFGVGIFESPGQLEEMRSLQRQFGPCLIEEFVSGTEITSSIIGTPGGPLVLPILELSPKNKFYDHEAKYSQGMTAFQIPARISAAHDLLVRQYSELIFCLFGCRGAIRVDFIVNPQTGPWVLEVNSLPGLTDLSDLPAQAKAAGISFSELIALILEDARCSKNFG